MFHLVVDLSRNRDANYWAACNKSMPLYEGTESQASDIPETVICKRAACLKAWREESKR